MDGVAVQWIDEGQTWVEPTILMLEDEDGTRRSYAVLQAVERQGRRFVALAAVADLEASASESGEEALVHFEISEDLGDGTFESVTDQALVLEIARGIDGFDPFSTDFDIPALEAVG
jgi:hypothetical protein